MIAFHRGEKWESEKRESVAHLELAAPHGLPPVLQMPPGQSGWPLSVPVQPSPLPGITPSPPNPTAVGCFLIACSIPVAMSPP
jgi:hypothetical protein